MYSSIVTHSFATNAASDLVIFSDGAISTALIKEAILDGSSLLELTSETTLSTSDAKAATGAQVKHIVLSRDVLIDDETFTESVTVANGGNVATNDLIIFADQQVTSEALKLQIN